MLFLVLTSHMHPPERRRKSYKKVNLTKYYNVIVVCVQSVYIFVYSGLRPTVQVYTHCTGLVTPASGAGAEGGSGSGSDDVQASHGRSHSVPSSLARPSREKRSTTLLLFQLLCYCCCCCCCSFCYHLQSPRNV